MNCDFDKLQLYFEGKLDTDEQTRLLNHLDQCESCASMLDGMYRDTTFYLWQTLESTAARQRS